MTQLSEQDKKRIEATVIHCDENGSSIPYLMFQAGMKAENAHLSEQYEPLQDEIDRLKKLARLAPSDEYQIGYLKALTNVSAIIDEMQTKQKLDIHLEAEKYAQEKQ